MPSQAAAGAVAKLLGRSGGADLLALLRSFVPRLAMGTPVSRRETAALLGCAAEDLDIHLAALPFRLDVNEAGELVGLGLTLRETRHRFTVHGRALYTWCALDALMFPVLLEAAALVSSTCAQTGAPIALTVTPEGVAAVEPVTTVVSIVPREEGREVRESFCEHVHFFASHGAAQQWVSRHPTGALLSAAEAFEVGKSLLSESSKGTECSC